MEHSILPWVNERPRERPEAPRGRCVVGIGVSRMGGRFLAHGGRHACSAAKGGEKIILLKRFCLSGAIARRREAGRIAREKYLTVTFVFGGMKRRFGALTWWSNSFYAQDG